jgi:predicted outer membrane repeat protein
MVFPRWLRNLPFTGHRRTGQPRPAVRFRPRLEALEERWLPSQIPLTVTSLADSGSGTLRDAIQTADLGKASDKFTIACSVAGTIDLQTPLPDLANNIAIQGPGAASLTVERAAGFSFAAPILTVDPGQTASLSGLTIANGNDGGIANGGTLTLTNCAVVNNFGTIVGGGITNQGTLSLTGCAVSGNSAFAAGGGIWSGIPNISVDTGVGDNASLTITSSTISGNSVNGPEEFGGGGIAVGGIDATATVVKSTLSSNSTVDFGGGIYFNSEKGLTVSGSTFCGNSAGIGGGGIEGLGVQMTVSGSTFTGNSAPFGGAVQVEGNMTVSGSTFCGNSAVVSGGGISNAFGGTLTLSGSTLSGNSAGTSGGAIYNGGAVTVRDSLFTGNSATDGGGLFNNGTLTVSGSTLSGNTATDSGGALYNLYTATVQQSTLSSNTAGSDGGGIFNATSGVLTIDDSSVLFNLALLGADLYNLGHAALNDSTVGVIAP